MTLIVLEKLPETQEEYDALVKIYARWRESEHNDPEYDGRFIQPIIDPNTFNPYIPFEGKNYPLPSWEASEKFRK